MILDMGTFLDLLDKYKIDKSNNTTHTDFCYVTYKDILKDYSKYIMKDLMSYNDIDTRI